MNVICLHMIKDKADCIQISKYKAGGIFHKHNKQKLIICFVFAETLSSKQSPSFPIKTSFLYKKIHNKSLENSLYIRFKMLLQ